MLHEIRIRDLGVIDEAVVELGPGLSVLTGETGAGKTMVVSGLGLLLGARAESALVRAGADRAVLEGVVDLPAGHPALERAAEAGADTSGELVLVRTVTPEGRSRAHVGGRSAPVGLLSELAEHLVALHGQADQWRLRHADQHRALLDGFGGLPLADTLAAYRQAYHAHARVVAEHEALRRVARERAREAEMIQVGLSRIEQVSPGAGEDVALRAEDERLSHAEELRSGARTAHLALAGDEDPDAAPGVVDGAVGSVARARAALAAASGNDPVLASLEARVVEVGHLLADVASDLAAYLEDVDLDPGRLEWVQARRAELARLSRAYGDSVDEVLDWARTAVVRAEDLAGTDERIHALNRDRIRLETRLKSAAAALSDRRRIAADTLGARVTEELAHLAMGAAEIRVEVTDSARCGPDGADVVEIQLAANPGSPPRSLTRAASGGELSRVMLAIEVATAPPEGGVPTFVFDEVDAGVGGRAALDVGARLAALARTSQVVVVTHLAQVAAFADRHLVVTKSDDGQVTSSDVRVVSGETRVVEIARMLAGSDSDAARRHARDLLARVRGEPSGRS